jgi:hypothetical protein
VSVPIVDLDTSNADFTSLLKFNRFENTPIGVSKSFRHRGSLRFIFVMWTRTKNQISREKLPHNK